MNIVCLGETDIILVLSKLWNKTVKTKQCLLVWPLYHSHPKLDLWPWHRFISIVLNQRYMDVLSQLKLYSFLLFYLVPMPKAFEFPFQFSLIWIFLAAILVWFSDILAGDTKSIVESLTKGRFWKLQIKLFIRQNLFILFLVYKYLRQCSRRHTNTFKSAIRKQYFDNFDTDWFFFRHRRQLKKSAKQIMFWSCSGCSYQQKTIL